MLIPHDAVGSHGSDCQRFIALRSVSYTHLTLVPITGFANAVVSPALEFKCEGLVMGVGAKMFVIAGPVLAYGISALSLIHILKITS